MGAGSHGANNPAPLAAGHTPCPCHSIQAGKVKKKKKMNKGQDNKINFYKKKKQNKKKVKFNLILEDFCHNGLTKDEGQRSSVSLIGEGYAR